MVLTGKDGQALWTPSNTIKSILLIVHTDYLLVTQISQISQIIVASDDGSEESAEL